MNQILLIFFFFILMPFLGIYSMAATVYYVGDSTGWTIIGNVDYNQWASSKTFQIYDTLIFNYDPQYHNVLLVSRSAFHSCDAASPIAAYSTGNDSIPIRSSGHYFYICGFVGHCQAGQKVHIRVGRHSIPGPQQIAAPIGRQMPCPFMTSGNSMLLHPSVFSMISFLIICFN